MKMPTIGPTVEELDSAARAEAEDYCWMHPGGPAAVRQPKITRRGKNFVALLGNTLETGISGIGRSVGAALRAFDSQYLASLRPPARKRRPELVTQRVSEV